MDLEHALLAGGGSGGHVFPALAVAGELLERGWRVSWLGRSEGMERGLVESAGLDYHGLPAKAVVGRTPWQRGVALAAVGLSSCRARSLVRRIDARVVLGTGGFVSAPGVLGAALARCPAVLFEANAAAGAANRWLSRWATAAAVAVESGARGLRCPSRPTGVPVRAEFRGEFRPPPTEGPRQVLVLGGSQGARELNRLLPSALASLRPAPSTLRVTHQVGQTLIDEARQAYDEERLTGIELTIVPFLEDVAQAMRGAHVVISRAGAITLAEICAIGRAAVLLPLTLAGSHQLANARRLVAAGGAVMPSESEVGPDELAEMLKGLLATPERLLRMGEACRTLYRPRAASEIADLMTEMSRAE